MFVDESGDHAYGKALQRYFSLKIEDHKLEMPINDYPLLVDDNKRYLALLGVIVKLKIYEDSIDPSFHDLKERHFRPFSNPGPIIMHRKEIINRIGPFAALLDPKKEKAYNNDLLEFFNSSEYILIIVVIDKLKHIETYGDNAFHPYHYCLAALLERYCGLLNFWGCRGDVLAESRGRNENKELMGAYNNIYEQGTMHRESSFFNTVLGDKLIIRPKKDDINGLQMSDLLANPLKKQCLLDKGKIESDFTPFAEQLCSIARRKYNHHYYSGRIAGYGIIYL